MASTVWRGHLAFGLVSFPVRLYRAARAEKVSFRRLYRPAAGRAVEPEPEPEPEPLTAPPPAEKRGAAAPPAPPAAPPIPEASQEVFRTRNAVVADAAEEAVRHEQLVKGYEYEKGQYVVLEDEELRNIKPETSKAMEIVEFVSMAEIDPIYLETSYYVTPGEAGERPYTLLYEALRQTGYVGLAQLAMHSREHIVVLRTGSSGLLAHTMFYPDEVRRTDEFRTDTSVVNPRELDLAKRLVESMVVPFEPVKFRDTYRERLEQIIHQKIAGRQVSREPGPAVKTAAVIDIMQALQESLQAVKKPAASAESQAPARKPKTRKAG